MDLGMVYMDGKLRHRPNTFMRVQDSKWQLSSSNCSNKREVRICLAAQTLFSIQPISRVLEVQMSSFLFCWKVETNAQNFHEDYLFKF
jgi:hypothetical protein